MILALFRVSSTPFSLFLFLFKLPAHVRRPLHLPYTGCARMGNSGRKLTNRKCRTNDNSFTRKFSLSKILVTEIEIK